MREDPSAPAPQAHVFVHATDAPQLTRVSHHSLGDVKFEILDGLIAHGGFEQSALRIVAALLRAVREETFGATGRLLCELTGPELQDAADLGRSSVFAVTRKLVAARVVWKEPGTGRLATLWEVLIPAAGGQTVQGFGPQARAPTVDPRRALQERAPGARPHSGPQARANWSARLGFGPVPAPTDSGAGACAGAAAFAAAPAAEEESKDLDWSAAGGDAAAAAAELARLNFGEATVRELAALPTTTAIVVRAAALEAAHKPADRRMGLIVHLVRKPDSIGKGFIARATRELTPAAVPPPNQNYEEKALLDRAQVLEALAALPEPELRRLEDLVLGEANEFTRPRLEKSRDQSRTSVWWTPALFAKLQAERAVGQ